MKRAKKVTISRISPVLKVNFSLSKNSKSIIISENSTLPRSHLARIYPTHYEILEKWPIKIDSYSSLIYTPSHSILSPDPSPSEISQEINQQQELFYLSDASVQSTYLDHLLQTNSSLVFSVDLSNQTLKESSSSTQLKQENSDGDQTPILGFESHSHSQEEEDEEVIACDPSTPSPCQSNTDRLREEEPAESHGSRSDEFPSEEYKDTIRKIHTIPPLRREIGFMVKALLDYIPTQPSTNKNSKGGPEIHETNSNSEMKDTNLLSQPDLPEELQLLVSETERVADHLIRTTLWLASQNTNTIATKVKSRKAAVETVLEAAKLLELPKSVLSNGAKRMKFLPSFNASSYFLKNYKSCCRFCGLFLGDSSSHSCPKKEEEREEPETSSFKGVFY